jgi:L-alanine-DL-glutamate epimerase-like enolase superfamily enzyme
MIGIVAAHAAPATFRLREGYRIAGHRFDAAHMVLLRITTSDGRTGHGCAAPFEEVTGESPAASLAALEADLLPLVRASDAGDVAAILERAAALAPGAPAARAALDMALHDLWARREGVPLYRLLGAARRRILTSVTLGIEDDVTKAVERGRRWVAEGFGVLKVKIGERWEQDAALVRALREALGPAVVLRADANQGYDEDDAGRFLRAVEPCGLELLEQPTPAGDEAALARLGRSTTIPIMADEALRTEADAERLSASRAAALFNVKLMKCGGIRPGLAIARRAAASGLGIMVGCNDESRVAIAAGLHLALAAPGDVRADLDGDLDLQDDVARGGFRLRDGWLEPLEDSGLGVSVDF